MQFAPEGRSIQRVLCIEREEPKRTSCSWLLRGEVRARRLCLGGDRVSGLGEGLGALRGAGSELGWGPVARGAHAGGAHYAIISISYLRDATR